ncbi:LuxR C-terminal-related transcriptional regulator [Streptomyces sp. NPDC057245]|uniref:LuxR C-terminal-related transcriptional regulator n=1 Tax=Streptomyces TaxID=1883 RepID=UPI001C1E0397|nr:LuxR family transcriptional regulator [Streptomyces sp. A108]MBU6532278.1 AAA family ATPase [Streptomyces sp. A108]
MQHILVERWSELLVLNRTVDTLCQGTGDLFMIEGGCGVGRTALLLELERIASVRQLTVCTARCSMLEADFPFGVLHQLLEPHLSTLAAGDSEAARPAAELLRAMDSPAGVNDVQVLNAMLWAIRSLAERAPVVLTIDDLNFCDAPSLHVLAYAARRLKGWPIAIVGTRRHGEPVAAPAMLAALQEAGEWTVLHPAPLTAAGTRELVDGVLGRTPVSVVEEVHELTGGNPMLLDTVLRASLGPQRESAGVDRSPGMLETLVGLTVRSRLSHLPPEVPRVAESLALLEGEADAALTAEAAGLPEGEGVAALAVLTGMGLLTDAARPAYVHPVVSKVLRRLPEAVAPEYVHRRAAGVLHRRGAPSAEVARHLLRTGPTGTEWAPEQLRAAATGAVSERDPARAHALLRRALEETLPDEVRDEMQAALDCVELITDPHGLLPRLRARLATPLTPQTRVRTVLAYAQGLLRTHQVEESAEALVECRDGIAALPPSRQREALLRQIDNAEAMTALFGSSAASEITGLLAKLPVWGSGGRAHRMSLESLRAAIEVRTPADAVTRALDEALADNLRAGQEPVSMPCTPFALLWTDQLEGVDQWCDAILTGRGTGSLPAAVIAMALRSASRLESGRLEGAERDARQALDLLGEQGSADPVQSLALAPLLKVLTELDRTDEAMTLLEDRGCAGELPDLWPHTMVLEARGRLRGARGDIEGALEDLMVSGRRMEAWGTANPAVSRWRSEAAFMRNQLGDVKGALRLVEEELRVARLWGTSRTIGVALRAKGLILGGPEGTALLAEAVEVLGTGPARLEEAYAEAGLGIVRRRGNNRRAARESLRRALARAQQLGAVRLASRVHAELLAAGGLPRRCEHFGAKALTASEFRVAQLAAVGRTNGSIARELFVTRRTVETHLTRAYRKLGIQSRSELGRVLQA